MLPAGHSWRRATLDDAVAIQAMVARHDTAIVGYPDCTVDDIHDQLTEPGLVIDADTWVVHAGGEVVGWAWTYGRGSGEYIDLDVITLDPTVRSFLFDAALDRAAALRAGHPSATIDIGVFRANTAMASVCAARGFQHAATFYRMRIDFDGDIVPPVPPAGVTLRSGPGDLEFRRLAHSVLAESFKGHFGFGPQPFDRWHDTIEQSSVFSWSQLTLAYLDGSPAGILFTSDSFVESENCGIVDDLGILPFARGRGIAKYLLAVAFARDHAAGRTGTLLHVDSNNTTGALNLYQSVGMHPTLVINMV
jgi:GNAT superfamily N-acetyltransferase